MRVRITQIDGKLPNLALMRISAFHKDRGDEVHFTRKIEPEITEPDYDRVYGSTIFKFSAHRTERFLAAFPNAVVGGTGSFSTTQVEDLCAGPERYDYEIYPDFSGSLGFTARGCRLSCKFCLVPGSLVWTGDGLKAIEDVEVGDFVLTHMGEYRPVVKTLRRYYKGNVVTLKSGAISELFPTTITDNHNVWTRHVSCYGSKHPNPGQQLTLFNWIEAGKLEARGFPRAHDKYAYPRTKSLKFIPVAPGTEDFTVFDVQNPRASQRTVDALSVDNDLMELLGFYLAEGHLSDIGRDRKYAVVFSFGHSDTERTYALRVSDTLRSYGLDPSVIPVPTGTRVTAYSTRFARWLEQEFGTGSVTKRVPLWVRLLPVERLKVLLASWCDGDGWFQIKKGQRTWKITTASPNLAVACREMALKCGYSATINKHHVSDIIQGRKVNTKPAFTVIYHEPKPEVRNSTVQDMNYVYSSIKDSVVSEYEGCVHNLEVAEIHSYCTPAFCISNCVVPEKEGKPKSVNTIEELWRGDPWPKHIHLLDNDFFGQPLWQERAREIIDGGFKVCFNQGLNVRLITQEGAEALSQMQYMDDQFKVRRIYTAFDNMKDKKIFFRGIDLLEKAGINPKDILAYMLIGFAKGETIEDIETRFYWMRERGIFPFPMVYDRSNPTLRAFARWAIRGICNVCSFSEYRSGVKKRDPRETDFFADAEEEEANWPVTEPSARAPKEDRV